MCFSDVIGSESELSELAFSSDSEVVLITPSDSADNCQTSTSTTEPLKSRNRTRNEDNWARNIRKMSRNMGMSHKSRNNVLVNAKEFKSIDHCCSQFCYKLFRPTHQKAVFDDYYKIVNFDLQTSYLCDFISVVGKKRCYTKNDESRRSKTRAYRIPDLSATYKDVCKTFF